MAEQSQRVEWSETPGMPSAGPLQSLRVTAQVRGQIHLPHKRMALDSLLARQVALIQHVPPASCAADCVDITIPIERDPETGIHMCSFSIGEMSDYQTRYCNRRPPIEKYCELGTGTGVVNLSLGVEKQYRIPYSAGHLTTGMIEWLCVGYAAPIRFLLSTAHHIGKRTKISLGRVDRWQVDQVDSWDGFPVMREGMPLRPLPLDYPGLSDLARQGFSTLTYPYWDQTKQEYCAVP